MAGAAPLIRGVQQVAFRGRKAARGVRLAGVAIRRGRKAVRGLRAARALGKASRSAGVAVGRRKLWREAARGLAGAHAIGNAFRGLGGAATPAVSSAAKKIFWTRGRKIAAGAGAGLLGIGALGGVQQRRQRRGY